MRAVWLLVGCFAAAHSASGVADDSCAAGWHGARAGDAELRVCWRLDGDDLQLRLAHPRRVWLGIGFGAEMAGSDAVIGRLDGGVQDVFIGGRAAETIRVDARRDVLHASVNFDGKNTVMQFTRKLDTGDAEDAVLSAASGVQDSVIWAVGEDGLDSHFARGVMQIEWGGAAKFYWSRGVLLHALCMLIAWGVLLPLGVIIARYYKVTPKQDFPRQLDNQFWWRWHRLLQYGGVAVVGVGLWPVWAAVQGGLTWHGIAGLLAVGLACLQVLSGWLRGSKGGPLDDAGRPHPPHKIRGDHYDMTRRRRVFEAVHKSGGYVALLVAAVAIGLGLMRVGASWFAIAAAFGYISVLFVWCIRLQRSGRRVDTYIAIWGSDPRHPGNRAPLTTKNPMTQPKIQLITDCKNIVGESPMWCVATQSLWWLDVRGKTLHRLQDGARRDWQVPDFTGCLALCKSGRLIVAQGNALCFFNPDDGTLQEFARPEPERPGNRFNDGKCDRAGRFWIGTMTNNFAADGGDIPIERATGAFYRLDADLRMARVLDDMWIPNTVAWSPDDRVFYLGDSIPNEIHAYDFDLAAGAISHPRLFAKNDDPGHLDGSATDEEGCLWNTRWGAGKIVRLTPDGEIEREIAFPVPAPSSCIFGGAELDTLFVTSARDTLSAAELAAHPQSGGVFAFQPGVRGLEEPVFAD